MNDGMLVLASLRLAYKKFFLSRSVISTSGGFAGVAAIRLCRNHAILRGHYQIDVQCINRHVTAGLCFEYLGSYESSEHALSNEVW